jgi:transcriptional antiterminator RfaH
MYWYVIHTKPRQEQRALLNLEKQGYECYLPILTIEKLRQGVMVIVDEPLFPRYLFINADSAGFAKGWSPIRSTKGVSRLITFGTAPAKVEEQLICVLRAHSDAVSGSPQRMFSAGDRVVVSHGPFAGLEGVYQMKNGESRAMVLIELVTKSALLHVAPANLRKVAG